MLKKLRVLFLGLVVLAGSACVTPTHASSASRPLISYVQAGGATGAKEELIVVYNNSPAAIDMTNWCLVNKSYVEFACLYNELIPGEFLAYTLPGYGYMTIASEEYVMAHEYPEEYYSLIYSVTSQGSGSIVGSSDTIQLLDSMPDTMSERSWTEGLASGKAWQRMLLLTEPDVYAEGNEMHDWSMVDEYAPPPSHLIVEVSYAPPEPELPDTSLPDYLPIITELLPNPPGADAGREYIELYNPSSQPIALDYFSLWIGSEAADWYELPITEFINPGQYRVYYNNELPFTLTNTADRVQLYYRDLPAGGAVEYSVAKDDAAWALIDSVWQYTKMPTPGASNVLPVEEEKVATVSTKKPCNANQFRNPETGRCKLKSSGSSTLTPCKSGQYRHPKTNRCRSLAANTSTRKPCKEGQERNPETNRCRNIKKMTDTNYKVQGVQTVGDNQPKWYYWGAIVVVIGLIGTYAIWEWRTEMYSLWQRVTRFFKK